MEMQPTPINEGDQAMESPDDEGFTVCIQCGPDGTFAVGMQGQEPEAMRPARDVKEALTVALQIIKSGGQQDKAMGDFQSGYEQMEAR